MYLKFRWADIEPIKLRGNDGVIEYNDLLAFVKSKKYRLVKYSFGSRKAAVVHTYCIFNNEKVCELRICHEYGEFERYILYKQFEDDALKENSGISGKDAYDHVEFLFQTFHNTDITLYRAFSGTKYKTEYKAVKNCVPKQIAYINPGSIGRIVTNCFKADVSSAFPSQMTKDLPTFHDCKKFSGIVEPNEEYPFAFYIHSGHIKIYNELDTHNMKNKYYNYYNEVYNDNVIKEETILCKKSKYDLIKEFNYMYNQRKVDINNKMYMNACIGYFHRNADPRLSLLAAVVIARNNNEMLKRVNQLVKEGNFIVYIATDSIVWRGKYSNVAINDKFLGSFTYEGINGKFFGRMVGAYQYTNDKNELTTKCSYIDNGPEKDKIEFGKLPEPLHSAKFIVNDDGSILNIFG